HDQSHKSETQQKIKWFNIPHIPVKNYSTRELFNCMLKALSAKNPDLIVGGSADLSESTGAKVPEKNYIHYGVREHAMGAIMNGLVLAGFKPYGSTFLVFGDYMRGAIRMAALMNLAVLFVFSHDSIALGEDGSTHQPVEQLPGLRMIPKLTIYRPCNPIEMFLCLKRHFSDNSPSAIILSRQSFAAVPESKDASVCGYVIAGDKNARVKLVATGSEVALALAVREKLESLGVKTSVMSVPSLEILMRENRAGIARFLSSGFGVWIEASSEMPPFSVSMVARVSDFGESGRGVDVYKKYGFDADYISDEIIKKIK
ncbi:MAG: transketolase, partial [Rickettsiales bacterium]|nr:transketolase [Rickettsiales bacterium]